MDEHLAGTTGVPVNANNTCIHLRRVTLDRRSEQTL
jgi:hypothetical protein